MEKRKRTVKRKKDLRKEIITKAIADPAFRRKLFRSPEKVFVSRLSKKDLEAVDRLKKMLPSIEGIVSSLAGEVLCGGGGGCGGLA